jgi:hypothetical protein
MAVFLLKSEHGSEYAPPACIGLFADVPCPGTADFPYSDWIERLSVEGITGGCSPAPPGGLPGYCPLDPVTRGEMAVFLVKTFGLVLYGPSRTPQILNVALGIHAYSGCPGTRFRFEFAPALIHVHVGDTVHWTWTGGDHSTTSGRPGAPDGNWDSGTQGGPFEYSHSFTLPGTFPYFCSEGQELTRVWCGTLCHCEGYFDNERGTVFVDP